jgi:condensin-2 complex subunit H2
MAKPTEDSRFAYLLQPIRDLAENWSIDIAKELALYLGELEQITFSFDGGHTSLNFTEAALLIQGSTCIYSKKVEYLYNLVLRTLDQVLGKWCVSYVVLIMFALADWFCLSREAIASSLDDAGKDVDAAFEEDADLLGLDDRIKGLWKTRE